MDTVLAPSHPVSRPAPASAAEIDRRIEQACAQACATIAPAWPLDRAIAVNPHWQRIGHGLRTVAARLAVLGGIAVLPPRERLREAWRSGRITPADLAQALAAAPTAGLDAAAAVAALDAPLSLPRLPLLIDVLDDDPQGQRRLSWRQAITHQVSQVCAAYFDTRLADWQPDRRGGLYAFWRDTLTHDHGIGVLMGLPGIARGLAALPATRLDAERWVLRRLGLPEDAWPAYLEAVLLTVHGWASCCAYLGWQARLEGRDDEHLSELLAVRLAWGALLLECRDDAATRRAFAALQVQWEQAPQRLHEAEQALRVDELWQHALEIGYQRELATRLLGAAPRPCTVPEAQAVFCIDVRSEPLRRALEAASPGVQTFGFAGFFGLPLAYTLLATAARRPQLPGLLAPGVEAVDRIVAQDADFGPAGEALQADAHRARQGVFARLAPWDAASRWPGAALSFVEAAGAAYLGPLTRWLRPGAAARRNPDANGLPARYRPLCRPVLAGLDTAARVELAARVLRAMGLAQDLAPLVVFVGHGSQSANNAQAAALDCGACCGQSGEVNARVLARLLNEPAVRDGLRGHGIEVPAQTVFVAALHNTTTDEVTAFDLDLHGAPVHERWARLQDAFELATDRVRRERAPALGLDARLPPARLLDSLRRRANDGAQTRPEWGLAGNAAFVIAPRARSLGAELDGRVFLHDYDPAADADGRQLEQLMTAPMLVAHWINWQYHASTCEPARLGSGNKLLHNVVGGTLGVFEGNGGDLRIGLSRQSLHDGRRWVHEPLRLTVIVDAPAAAIERVLAAHTAVRQLVEHGWLHLWRFAGDAGFERYGDGCWESVAVCRQATAPRR
ncbi:MAG: DUF2309 domain-containing protein [Rubrivivax sp.]